jgi:hypothetical protein
MGKYNESIYNTYKKEEDNKNSDSDSEYYNEEENDFEDYEIIDNREHNLIDEPGDSIL